MPEPGQAGQGRNGDRLDGWKDVAAYIRKTIRTAQRWEQELGMPVHRIPGASRDIVYAFGREIEEWRTKKSAQPNREAEPVTAWRWLPRRRWLFASIALVTVIAGAALLRPKLFRYPQPVRWIVVDGALHALDASGVTLWKHRFDFPLLPAPYTADVAARRSWVGDLDGDGSNEIVLIAVGPENHHARLYIFNADGSVRYTGKTSDAVAERVTFGDNEFRPPFFPMLLHVAQDPNGRGRSVWVAYYHNLWFPSFLQKITPDARIAGEYWSNGHITGLREAFIAGRHTMLVGGINNEFDAASLTMLDYEDPTAAAPAANPAFRCRTCAEREPLAFFVLPKLDLGRTLNSRAVIYEFRTERKDRVTAIVHHGNTPLLQGGAVSVFYTLSHDMRLEAEFGATYPHIHSQMELAKRLDHQFGPRDTAEITAVRQWRDGQFVHINVGLEGAIARRLAGN